MHRRVEPFLIQMSKRGGGLMLFGANETRSTTDDSAADWQREGAKKDTSVSSELPDRLLLDTVRESHAPGTGFFPWARRLGDG